MQRLCCCKPHGNAPSMDAVRMGASVLSINDPAVNDESVETNLERAKRLTAQIPVIVARMIGSGVV